MRLLTISALALTLVPALAAGAQAQDDVRVYRCTDERGRVALRDSPCDGGQRQEVRTMLRPVDGTPIERLAPPPPAAVPPPAPQIIVVNAPQPMYRCIRPDGSSYTSDSSEGNPRWVPLWTLGYGPPRGRPPDYGGGGRPPRAGIGYGGAGTWVRDECRPMPQGEVCSLITERREAIRQRFFNAQPTERAELSREERAIDARLAQDCRR